MKVAAPQPENLGERVKPYRFRRWLWWGSIDLGKLTEELKSNFKVERISTVSYSSNEVLLDLFKKEREKLKVTADTLTVRLAEIKAVLYQRVSAPFTPKDLELRTKVFKLYPHNRETPIAFPLVVREPKFKVMNKKAF